MNKAASFGFRTRTPAHADAAERVKAWTRERFALPEEAAIMVAEVACAVPGCPPLETVIAFWTAAEKRHHFKVFKPLAQVEAEDLPPPWLKDALADVEGFGCDCC